MAETPEQNTKVGGIKIDIFLGPDGVSMSYVLDSITKDAAIGHMTVIMDRLREERKYEWATCPDCRRPWSAHDEDFEDFGEDEDYEFGEPE